MFDQYSAALGHRALDSVHKCYVLFLHDEEAECHRRSTMDTAPTIHKDPCRTQTHFDEVASAFIYNMGHNVEIPSFPRRPRQLFDPSFSQSRRQISKTSCEPLWAQIQNKTNAELTQSLYVFTSSRSPTKRPGALDGTISAGCGAANLARKMLWLWNQVATKVMRCVKEQSCQH